MNQPIIYRQEDLSKPAPRQENKSEQKRERQHHRGKRAGKKAHENKSKAAPKAAAPKPPVDKRTNLERQQQYHVVAPVAEYLESVWPSLRVMMNVVERKERDRLRNSHTKRYANEKDPDKVPLVSEPQRFDLIWTPPLTGLNQGGGPFNDIHQMEAGLAQLLHRQGINVRGQVIAGPGRTLGIMWEPPAPAAEQDEPAPEAAAA